MVTRMTRWLRAGMAATWLLGAVSVPFTSPQLAYAACANPTFNVLLTIGAGGAVPVSAAVADFNGDGKADLAVVGLGSGNVTIHLGNGAGGFPTAASFGVGAFPYGVATGDFNGDGNQDVAVTLFEPAYINNVTILLGNGAGGLAPATKFQAGDRPREVVAADFNGDGILDLATANHGGNNVSVLLGNGAGGFGAATNFGAGTGPNGLAVADLNGDGWLDLAVTNALSNSVSILLATGREGSGPPRTTESDPYRARWRWATSTGTAGWT